MGTATPTAILAILDKLSTSFKSTAYLAAYNAEVATGAVILTQAATYDDNNLAFTVGQANSTLITASFQITNNRKQLGNQFSQLSTWISQFSGAGSQTLDGYLLIANTAVPFTYLVSPVTAFQSYLAPGNTPAPNSSGVASTTGFMTPSNVFAPVVTFGSANITGTNTVTYTNNLNLPTSNNSIQIISVTGVAGTWTYTYKNVPSGAIAYNASASTAQTAINAVSTVGAGGVIVTSPSTGVYIVQDVDAFSIANPNIPNASVAGTGGAAATLQNASSSTWVLTITASAGNYTLQVGSTTGGLYTTVNIAFGATAATIQADLQALAPIGVNVAVTGSGGIFQIAFTGILANQRFDYNFLAVNQGTLSGGIAKLYQTVIGGTQGYTGPATVNAVVTTTVNGTCALTVTANAVDAAGVFRSSRTFTATLNSATAGTIIALVPTVAGDRVIRMPVASTAIAGTATAGAWDYTNPLDRVIT